MQAATVTMSSSTYYPPIQVVVSGRVLQIRCSGIIAKDIAANLELTIGTIPAAYRPPNAIIKYVLGGNTTSRMFRISIATDGTLTLAATSALATGSSVNINETFVAKPN